MYSSALRQPKRHSPFSWFAEGLSTLSTLHKILVTKFNSPYESLKTTVQIIRNLKFARNVLLNTLSKTFSAD